MKTITTAVRGALAIATLGLATAFAPVAQADELHPTGFAAGEQTFGLSTGQSVRTGGFEGEWNDEDIIFWCIQLGEYFSFGPTYTDYVPHANGLTGMSPSVVTLLGKLFTLAYGSALLDTDHSAAFQLAIWEIVYDPTNFKLSNSGGNGGAFYVTTSGHANTQALAQTWLTELATNADDLAASNLVFLQSLGYFDSKQKWVPGHQDFVTYEPRLSQSVPEPHGLALVALAMLAMVAVLRGRRRRVAQA